MESNSACSPTTSYGGSTQSIFGSHRHARSCAQPHLLQRSLYQAQRTTYYALLKLQDPSLKHGRRRDRCRRQAATCIAAPEVVERTFGEGKVRKVGDTCNL